MGNERIVDRAARIAVEAHAGQVDKLGAPYILHVARVAVASGDDLEACAVGWLHDAVEDTGIPITRIVDECGVTVAEAVAMLSKTRGETHANYVRRIQRAEGRAADIARRVKLADVYDNIGRIPADEEWSERLVAKYARALRILEGTE